MLVDADVPMDPELESNYRRIAKLCQLDARTSVLDVGTGNGGMFPFYEACGVAISAVTGVDLSDGMLEYTRKRYSPATLVKGDICTFEDPNCRLFDRVVFNSCFESIHDQEFALRHVTQELIVGGGLLIISEPRGKAGLEAFKKANPRAVLHGLSTKAKLQKLVSAGGDSGSAGVHSAGSPLLSVESVEDEDGFYCAVLRRSCADF